MGGRLARRQRPRAHLEKRMIVHDHAGDKRLLRVALVVLARASARAATVVAVAALAVTLALAESVAAFERVAVIGGGGGAAEKLGDATDGLALAESVATFEPVAVIGGRGGEVLSGGGGGARRWVRVRGGRGLPTAAGRRGGRDGELSRPAPAPADDG